jgi:hypothetical protein
MQKHRHASVDFWKITRRSEESFRVEPVMQDMAASRVSVTVIAATRA